MKLTDRFRNAYKVLTSSTLGNSVSGQVLRNYQNGAEFRPQQQLKGITYKAIDKIGMSLSVYQPQIAKKSGDAYKNHPLLNLYEYPNDIQRNPSDFIHLYGMLFEIYGETFWYLARGENSKKIKELILLNPAQMELFIEDGELKGYVLHKADGNKVPLELDEVYHDKRANPFNYWRGMSVMEKAATYIDTEIVTSTFTLNYMKNNASPSGIVSLPNMDKTTFTQFAQEWREGYEGPENAGKTAFIRGGEADFKAVGATLKDVDQKITRQMAINDVLMMLEMPKELLGISDDSGFGRNTIEAFSYIFAKEKIEPMMKRLDRIYSDIWSMQPSREQAIVVTHESPIPEDKDFRHKVNKDLVNVALTVNEVREQMGLPPMDGGDELAPANQAKQPVEVQQAKTATKKVVLKKKLTRSEILKQEEQSKEDFRQKLMATNDIYERKLKLELSKFLQDQEERIYDKISGKKKAYEEWLYEPKEEAEALALLLLPILIDLMKTQGEDVTNFITGAPLIVGAEEIAVVETKIKQLCATYNIENYEKIESIISAGVADGKSLPNIKKDIGIEYDQLKGYKSERIARTESLRATNRTAELVYKQNGYSEVKWFVNPGACAFCLQLADRTKQIGGNYVQIGDVITVEENNKVQTMRIEYDDIDTPPLHPNCRCSLVPSGNRAE